MKKILVPTDFSANAQNALNFAILLAKKAKAKLFLFHAFQAPVPIAEMPYNLTEEMIDNAKKEAETKLRSECEKIKLVGGIDFDYHAAEGEALEAILDYTESNLFDYIIIGTKGAGKHSTGIFGTTASRLMAKTNIPTIAVPEKAKFTQNINKITFATNYIVTDIDAIAQLSRLASAFNAQLTVLHVCDKQTPAAEQSRIMEDFSKKVKADTDYNKLSFQILCSENTEEGLQDYVNQHDTDIIVMSTHLRNALERLFGGSLTKRIALKTEIPLVVFHHQKEPILS